MSNATPNAGDSVTVTYDISNIGSGSAIDTTAGIYLSTNNIISTADTRLATQLSSISNNPSSVDPETQAVTLPGNLAPGDYWIGVVADYNNQETGESNENNNASSGFMITIPQPQPIGGTSGPDTLAGTSGNNIIPGLDGNDTIYGYAGDDLLDGGNHADYLDGGQGDDTIIGGGGNDTLTDPLGDDTLDGGIGHDQIILFSGTNVAHGGAGNDSIAGGIQGDQLFGDAGNDVIRGDIGSFGGADVINGGTGNDNDVAAPVTSYSMTPSAGSVDEGGNYITFTISRSGDLPSETVYFSTLTTEGYSNNGDYAGHNNTAVSFSSGATSRTVRVYITDDSIVEANERFGAIVQRSGSDPISTYLDRSTFTINDNDAVVTPSDTVANDTNTTTALGVGQTVIGTIDQDDLDGHYIDKDYYKVVLTAGQSYTFSADANLSTTDTLDQVFIRLRDANGNAITSSASAEGATPSFTYDVLGSGAQTYYLAISAGGSDPWWDKTGEYGITLSDSGIVPPIPNDDYADTPSETGTTNGIGSLTVGGSISGTIGAADANDNQYGDKDVFSINLQAGTTYTFNLDGTNGLNDGIFTLRAANFDTVLAQSNQGGPASLSYNIDTSGTYYVRVGTGIINQQGDYTLSVVENDEVPLPPTGVRSDILQPIIVEMAYLASAAYLPAENPGREGWVPVFGPSFSSVSTANIFGPTGASSEVYMHVYETYIDGVRTLAITFSGTPDEVSLINQIGQWDDLYRDFRPTISSILDWADNQPNGSEFGKLLLAGHSLGGILVESFLADDALKTSNLVGTASGITFGSPGSTEDVDPDVEPRLTNFVTLGDFVPMLHSDDFFNIEAKPGSEADTQRSAIELALTLEGLATNPKTEAISLLNGSVVPSLSRDGTTITMVSTETTIIDLLTSKLAHSMQGAGGYVDNIEKLSAIFDSSFESKFAGLEAWENASGGWRFLKPDSDLSKLDLAIAFSAGIGFEATNLVLSNVRFLVNNFNTIGNASVKISTWLDDQLRAGADGFGSILEGTKDKLNNTFSGLGNFIKVKFLGENFSNENVDYKSGSAIISMDFDLDGTIDTQTHLLGDFDLDRFFVVPDSDGTAIVYSKYAQLNSSESSDILVGDSTDERISAFSGDDFILGLGGDDTIDGGAGNDTILGGLGDDILRDSLGDDTLDGGIGHDQIILFSGTNVAHGGAGNDSIAGGIQGDQLFGDAGNDVIRGDIGSFGGADVINGGTGNDIMMGGAGADVFVFATNDGADTIAAFNAADVAFDPATGYSATPAGADFEVGVDRVQLEGFATVNATNVTGFISSTAQGALFSAEGTDITFLGVDAATLTADDFTFL